MVTVSSNLDYRAAVGPPDKYDIIGAQQFCVLIKHGLREHHTLCDIGCGSLRGGKLFIAYLLPGHYYGIEPNADLVNAGIKHELGDNVIGVKRPHFKFRDDFNLRCFMHEFDYILAQSIFSHASPDQIEICLWQVKQTLTPDGKFLGTWFEGEPNYAGDTWRKSPCVTYTRSWLADRAKEAGLTFSRLPHGHESGQRWFLMKHREGEK